MNKTDMTSFRGRLGPLMTWWLAQWTGRGEPLAITHMPRCHNGLLPVEVPGAPRH